MGFISHWSATQLLSLPQPWLQRRDCCSADTRRLFPSHDADYSSMQKARIRQSWRHQPDFKRRPAGQTILTFNGTCVSLRVKLKVQWRPWDLEKPELWNAWGKPNRMSKITPRQKAKRAVTCNVMSVVGQFPFGAHFIWNVWHMVFNMYPDRFWSCFPLFFQSCPSPFWNENVYLLLLYVGSV